MITEVFIIFILILLGKIIFNKENFTIYDSSSNQLYEKKNCYHIKNNSVLFDIKKVINNSIFIDNRIISSKNKEIKYNQEYKFFAFAINPYNNLKFLLFEKHFKNNLFDYYLIISENYYLFENIKENYFESEQIIKLPPRDKIYLDDIIYIKNYGYYKIII